MFVIIDFRLISDLWGDEQNRHYTELKLKIAIANNPRMVHGSNSSLSQLIRITITVAKSEKR